MNKGKDSLCPLGFHPQFRRPNYCKRCFREYGEHKVAKESSTTSINSLSFDRKDDTYGSRDSLVSTSRFKDEYEGLSRSRSDLSKSYEDGDNKPYGKKSMSWSAQDLRKAVDDAKDQVRTTRDEVARYYGSTRSLTQDLGTLSHLLHDSTSDLRKAEKEEAKPVKEDSKQSSFSSYLAMRTKSPVRPPLTKSTSLNINLTSPSRLDETDEEKEEHTTPSIKRQISPSKLKPEKVLPFTEPKDADSRAEKNKKIIQSLREVKSEDADASYVIKIRPKKSVPEVPPPKKVEIDLQPEVERLQRENKELLNQVQEMTEKCDQVESENRELLAKKPKFGDLKKQTDMTKMNTKIEELNEEIKKKNKEVKDMKKELEKRPLPKNVEKTMEDLRSKLAAAEQLCEELMDENEDYKKEVKTLEDEIEEMQDNFREEQADEYRDLKRELEQRAKDCRVLQFKLKKAERRSDQLERDKGEYEEKLKELQVGEEDIGRAERVKQMEKELSLAKEVSMKMHEEMEKMKTQLELAETDKQKLTEKVQDVPAKPGTKFSRSQVLGRQGSQDNLDQVLRDLQDTLEREQDLKEQLKFAEEETKNVRKKLSRIEEENETLQLQLNKMSTKAKQTRQRSLERSGSQERAETGSLSRQGSTEKPLPPVLNGEDLDPTELKIQLELHEQESTVLRRKVEDLESENMRLQKEFREILSSSDSKKTDLGNIPELSKDNIYFSKKIKMLETEMSDLRKKLIDYEKENDQLKLDLETSRKRAKVVKSRSLEQAEAEEKKAQENLERETDQLKKKFQELEEKYEKVLDENKRLTLKTQKRFPLTMQENAFIEKQVLEDKVKRLEKKLKEAQEKVNSSPSSGSNSSDSRLVELQTKVDELQEKCDRLTKDSEEMRSGVLAERVPKKPKDLTPKPTLVKWVNELEAECTNLHAALKEAEKSRGISRSTSEDSSNIRDLQDKLQREKERNEELTRQLQEERGKSNDNLSVQRSRFGASSELRSYEDKINRLNKDLAEEKEKYNDLKTQLREGSFSRFDEVRTAQTEKHKLQKELSASQQSVNVLERKVKEMEETLKTGEKAERNLRALLEKAESRESQLLTERKKADEVESRARMDKEELKKTRKDYENLQIELDEVRDTLSRLEKEKEKSGSKQNKEIDQLKKEKEDLTIRMTTLETELKTEKKKRERLERDSTLGLRGRNAELEDLKDKVTRLEHEKQKQISEHENWRQDHESNFKDLEKQVAREKKEYEKLQANYNSLKDEMRAHDKLSDMKLGLSNADLRLEYEVLEKELKALRETYVTHQDKWIKEKLDMQLQLKDYKENKLGITSDNSLFSEKLRLKNIIEDKNHQVENFKTENDTLKDQLTFYRRESEDLRRKVDDLEKLQDLATKHQGNSSVDTKGFETTIKDLRARLTALEKTHKSETTKMKMRYDSKVKSLSEEASAVTQHMTKYRRERDTYREMLDGAQKNIAELKGSSNTPYRVSRADNVTEAKAHLNEIQDMQSLVTDLEDKLADSRLEATRLKNEIGDQKTNFEIQISDIQTKLNEYEEDRLLGGGGRRVPGLRTRLELNWQKEREEQQRLIQETATLAKDLRQTLYEVERERDMERLESKRKVDQLKRTVNQDHYDTKSKVQELQRDLQELREAHAKLRQINEKLRREKDRTEVEREAMRDKFLGTSREHLNQQAKMERLLDELKKVKELAPLVLGEGIDGKEDTLTKLPADPKPRTKEEFTEALRHLNKTSDDLRVMMSLGDDRDRLRRTPSFRRALSGESDDESSSVRSQSTGRRAPLRQGQRGAKNQLYRKSQSLDHQLSDDRNKIWVSTDAGSTSSIESAMTDDPRRSKYDFDRSLDRISTGSQTSDLDLASDQKKGLKTVFNKLGKSKSIEDTNTAGSIVGAGLKAMAPGLTGSGSSITSEGDSSSVKGRLKNLFRKVPQPRSHSSERDNSGAKKSADESASASNTSINSTSSGNVPPVMRRLQGRSAVGSITKAQSFTYAGKKSTHETNV